MKMRNILMVPLFAAFLVGCGTPTNYNALNTAKYAAKKLNTDYRQLPNEAYYAVDKVLSSTAFDAIKEDFPNYLPKGFTLMMAWHETTITLGLGYEITEWNTEYMNGQTKAEGDLYYRDGGANIQLTIVTSPYNH